MLSLNKKINRSEGLITTVVIIISLFLNHSNVIVGINTSIADFFLPVLTLLLILGHNFHFPMKYVIFFFALSTVIIATSLFWTNSILLLIPDIKSILVNYLKLIVSFLYFIVGFNLAKHERLKLALKWFSIGAVILGLIGILYTFSDIGLFRKVLFYSRYRYRGLMNDPNFFSIIQLCAIGYYSSSKDLTVKHRKIASAILIVSILISGSKTGTIGLIILYSIKMIRKMFSDRTIMYKIVSAFLIIAFIILLGPFIITLIGDLVELVSRIIPAFQRVAIIFTDFNKGISVGGSSRDYAWNNAIEFLRLSPIFGIGIGTYGDMGEIFFGSRVLAHNTYLQLAVEWGLLFGFIFFGYILLLFYKFIFKRRKLSEITVTTFYFLIAMLAGSFAISLNNARLFWLILGGLVYLSKEPKEMLINSTIPTSHGCRAGYSV